MSSHVPHVHMPWRHGHHHPPSVKPLLDGVDLASPLRCGYLFKEGHSHVVFHKRFFVLFPRVLLYYEKESVYNKDVAKGTLEHCHKAITLKGLYLTKPEKKPKGAKFSFILHAPDESNERRDFLFVAESREERKHWIEVLQDQNPDLVDSEHHTKRIYPDTPQATHRVKISHSMDDSVPGLEHSSIASVTSQGGDGGQDTHNSQVLRPGSPRHDLHRLTSSSSSGSTSNMTVSSSTASMDLLDIQHLDIREGPSDTEDS